MWVFWRYAWCSFTHNIIEKKFILITVHRCYALANSWLVIPRHPLSGTAITLLDYETGLNAIDWDTMNRRDYNDEKCKCVCMAECLSPATVPANDFHSIYVPDAATQVIVNELKQRYRLDMHININSHMFPGV